MKLDRLPRRSAALKSWRVSGTSYSVPTISYFISLPFSSRTIMEFFSTRH